jgi:BRCA1-associated protein
MNPTEFLKFIEKFIFHIKFIRFIYDAPYIEFKNNTRFLRSLIYFQDQDSADNFYYEFNTKSFQKNKFEYLYCVFIDKIIFSSVNQLVHKIRDSQIKSIDLSKLDSSKSLSREMFPEEKSELFMCPICLEKIDSSKTGIHTLVNMVNIERWDNYRKGCLVCSKLSELQKCSICATENGNIYCCMICGVCGCDRYQHGHGVEHFHNTFHRFTIDLISQRIWDYIDDTWVHRVIKINPHNTEEESNKENIIALLENANSSEENLNSKEFLMRLENIISEYNFVLALQLEEQRKYYENEISKMTENNDFNLKNKVSLLSEMKEEIKNKLILLENTKKLYKEFNKKLNQQDKKLQELKEQIELNQQLIKNVNEDLDKEKIILEHPIKNEELTLLNSKIKHKEELEKQLNELYELLSNKK